MEHWISNLSWSCRHVNLFSNGYWFLIIVTIIQFIWLKEMLSTLYNMGQQRNNKETRYPMQQNMLIQQTIQNSCIKYDLWNIYIYIYINTFKWCLQEARRRFGKTSQVYDQELWTLDNSQVLWSFTISLSYLYFVGLVDPFS
jgi:hypothetical protein